MKELPSFHNYKVCDFMIDLTEDCVESYKTDVAHDVKSLYNIVLNGRKEIYWGVRRCGTGMGYENSEFLNFYKNNNMIVLFKFTNLNITEGDIYGDIELISYTEPYENKWYNDLGKEERYYHAGDDWDLFYNDVRRFSRKFIQESKD